MATQPLAIEDSDNYYIIAEKSLLRTFETTTSSAERPHGNPTFEDDQGNICLGPALLQPTAAFDSFYPKSECTSLLYERDFDMAEVAQGLTFRHWPKTSPAWTKWLDRVQASRAKTLHDMGIFRAMNVSRYTSPQNNPMVFAALCFWNPSFNFFQFNFGMLGPTILDVCQLLGFPFDGTVVTPMIEDDPEFASFKYDSSFSAFIEKECKTTKEVSD